MAGYLGRPLAAKLGIKANAAVCLSDALLEVREYRKSG